MDARDDDRQANGVPRRADPPAFNVPGVVLVSIVLLVATHVLRTQVLGQVAELQALVDFAFVPGCYDGPVDFCRFRTPGADLWSPVTHAVLHADWTHLGANCLWLLAFGTPVARRIGPLRFLLFCLGGAACGALLFYVVNPHLLAPMIGASGVVSAVMGGASRFALGSMDRFAARDVAHAPLQSVARSLTNRTVVFFVAIFFATNLLIGSGIGFALGAQIQIAWEAHLGGFAFGFLAFALFDRRSTPPRRG